MNDTSICHFPTAVRSGWCWSLMRFKQRWKSFRGSFEMKCLRVRRQREPTHKLLNVSLKSDMMFASNVWPFPGNFGFWKPYYLHTMDRLWSTSGTWDGFSQLTFLLQISPIPTCISRCNISDSYEVVWILPVLTIEIFWWFVSRGNTLRLTKNRVPHTGVFFLLGPLASKKTGKFVARQQGLQLWWLLHFQSGLLLLLLHRSLVWFFFFLCHLGWFGMRFCCVFTGVLGSFGWFSDTQKKMGLTLKGGQWMIQFF